MSPNMDFTDDRSSTEDIKKPVQERVGGNNPLIIPVVQHQQQGEENPEEEIPLSKESKNRRLPEQYGSSYTFNRTKRTRRTTKRT